MRKKGKVVLTLFLFVLFLLLSLSGIIAFYAYHPSKVKPFIESAVSRTTGAQCTIDTLSYSFKPFSAVIGGLSLRPAGDSEGFELNVSELRAEMALEGPFARRRLVVKSLFVERPSFLLKKEVRLPGIQGPSRPSSFFSKIVKSLIALFLFREVVFQAAGLEEGHAKGSLGRLTFDLTQIRGELNAEHRVDLFCRGELNWPDKSLHLVAEAIHVSSEGSVSIVTPVLKGILELQEAHLQSPGAVVDKGALRAEVTYRHAEKILSFDPMEAHIQGLQLHPVPNGAGQSLDLRLEASGECHLQTMSIKAYQFDATAEDLFHIKGDFQAGFQRQVRIRAGNLDGYLVPQRLLSFFPNPARGTGSPPKLSGRTGLRGDLEGSKEHEGWLWRCDLQSTLSGNRFAYETGDIRVKGDLTGEARVHGLIPDLEVSLDLKAEEAVFAYRDLTVKPVAAQIRLSGKHPLYTVNELTFHVPLLRFNIGREERTIKDVRALAHRGTLNAAKLALQFPEIELNSSVLKNLRLSLDLGADQLSLALKGKETGLAASVQELHILPEGWKSVATDRLRLDVALKHGRNWSVRSEIDFEGLSFENSSGTAAGQGIVLHGTLSSEGRLGDPYAASSTRLELVDGEILLDQFYVNLGKYPFKATADGDYDRSRKELRIEDLTFGLNHILGFRLKGEVGLGAEAKKARVLIQADEVPVEPIFHHLVFEPFRMQRPFLNRLKPEGNVSVRVELGARDGKGEAKGHIFWRGGELLDLDQAFSFHEIDLDLPFWYRNQGMKGRDEAPSFSGPEELQGHLTLGSVTLPLLPAQALRVPIRVIPNMVSIPVPTTLRLRGGDIKLNPVIARFLFPKPPSVVTSLTAHDMDLTPLLSRIWPRPVQGLARVDLDPVRFEKNTVQAQGKITASIFGGKVTLSNPSVSGVFSAAPILRTDVTLEDLHLAELTKETTFGRIEGILEGDIKNLEIAYGQPQAFDLRLETRKEPGVPQKISVRAVDNIAQIGGGRSPFTGLAEVFASFFKEFPYEKIGIHASLKNDMFRINGTIKEGGKEYLVKRSGFSGVNVVNQNPDNLISFKDMVKRIERVTSSKSGPVVK